MNIRELFGIILHLIVAIIFVCVIGYIFWIREGRTLSAELVPTAEYLAQSALAQPRFIGWIDPPQGATLSQGERLCVQVLSKELGLGSLTEDLIQRVMHNTQFIINNRPLPLTTNIMILRAGGSGDLGGELEFCVEPPVDAGLHLIEIQVNALTGTTYSYAWVFRMSDVDPSTSPTSP